MENNLEIVRKAVIRANPIILDLKFGCEVGRGANIRSKEVVVGFFGEKIALVRRHPTNGDFLPFEVPIELKNTWKILGRPIRLADVLVAIFKNKKTNVAVQDNGCIMVETPIEDENENIGWSEVPDGVHRYHWNIFKDDLFLQSPETLEFLANLLK